MWMIYSSPLCPVGIRLFVAISTTNQPAIIPHACWSAGRLSFKVLFHWVLFSSIILQHSFLFFLNTLSPFRPPDYYLHVSPITIYIGGESTQLRHSTMTKSIVGVVKETLNSKSRNYRGG